MHFMVVIFMRSERIQHAFYIGCVLFAVCILFMNDISGRVLNAFQCMSFRSEPMPVFLRDLE